MYGVTRSGEKIFYDTKQQKTLEFIYGTKIGRIILKVIYKPFISKVSGIFLDSSLSKFMIKKFVKKNNINLEEYEVEDYNSFNEFFTRKIRSGKRIINSDNNILISPCDSKLSIYKIESDNKFHIKESHYCVTDLLDNAEISKEYMDGYCLIFRLTVDDYHRYCYLDNGVKDKNIFIKGVLHTVNPIADKKYKIYKTNCREYTVLHTKNFGDVIQMEVGAMIVGKITNYHDEYTFSKGEEKGKFEFGGSTIVLLFKKGVIKIDEDIVINSNNGIETIVKMGEKIGSTIIDR